VPFPLGIRGTAALALGCLAIVVAAVAIFFSNTVSFRQDSAPPKDTIFARKILMGAIDMNMDEIETMLAPEGKLDLAEGQEHAETISTMLMAFPHMFPPRTNQWKPGMDRDPATDTFASPDVWKDFSNFYQRATAASKLAFDASRAKRAADFKPLIAELRTNCNACHALYMKTEPAQ
jgi:cytochrome c556